MDKVDQCLETADCEINMDRISDLPEPLMEKILFSLPTKDAIRMSFSSRQWQTLWNSVWNSISVSSFVFENRSHSMPRKKFVTRVDNVLRNLPDEYEDQKSIVRFELVITTLGRKMKDSDVVDRWMKKVTKNYVRALKFEIETAPKIRYRFPPAAFDVGVLVVLELTYCTLEKSLFIQEHTVFIRLKKLIFEHVDFNGVVAGELLSRCPLLETLKLSYCENIKHLKLCDVPYLKSVELWNDLDDENIFTYKIDSPNLKSLIYYEDGKPMNLEAVSSNNLKKLDIITHGSTIPDQYIKEVCAKFPLLEDLCLNAESFGSDIGEIRISGHHLKSLIVCGTIGQHIILNLDAPNLHRLQREDDEIPPTFLMDCVKVESINFIVCGNINLNSAWFFKLRDYLGKFTDCDRLRFRICHWWSCRMVKFPFEELQAEKLAPVPRVRKLVLNSRGVPSSRGFKSFIDGLFWTCQPLTISVQSFRAPNRRFIKLLYRLLMDREERPLCCRDCRVKCWRHSLISVKIKSSGDFKDKRVRAYIDDVDEANEEPGNVFDIYDYDKDHKEEEEEEGEEEEEEEEEEDEDEEGEGEGVELGDEDGGEGEVGLGGDGEEEEEDNEGDDNDDSELLKTLKGLEKDYLFELQWSTLENGSHAGIVGLELVF